MRGEMVIIAAESEIPAEIGADDLKLHESHDQEVRLVGSVRQIQSILRDHQPRIDLINDDPCSIL